jgi:hypothetical protein
MSDFPKDIKIKILRALGLESDGKFVLDAQGNHIRDNYVDMDVELDNMWIFPGSTIVLDNNPLSVASYLEEHPDAF